VNSLLGAVSSAVDLVRRHPLAAFFVTTFCFSWADWLALAASGQRVAPGVMPTHFAGLLGPGFAAVAVTFMLGGTRALKELVLRIIRFPWWSPAAWILPALPLAFLATGLGVLAVGGDPLPSFSAFARFPGVPPMEVPAVFDVVLIAAALGQELGWRGFALPRLQERHGPLQGALVLAAVWGAWLLPQFLVNESWAALGPATAAGLAVTLAAASVALAHVVARCQGGIGGASFWHATFQMGTATAAAQGSLATWVSGAVVVWGGLLVVGELQARDEGRTLLAPPPEAAAFRWTRPERAP
jgi:membrane protease YdiL (CAAX protease family)